MLCPYGSQPQTGAPAYQWATWIDAHSWLGAVFDILSPLVVAIQPVLHETATFCATEPPQPVYPGDAVVAAAWHDRVAWEQCYQYLQDSATWWVWSHTCECLPAPDTYSCLSVPANSFSWPGHASVGATYNRGSGFKPLTTGLSVRGIRFWGYNPESSAYGVGLYTTAGVALATATIGSSVAGYQEFLFSSPVPVTSGTEYIVAKCVYSNVEFYAAATLTDDSRCEYTQGYYNNGCGAPPLTPNPGGFPAVLPLMCSTAPPATPAYPAVPTTSIPALPAEACSTTADLCAQMSRMLVAEQLTQRRVDLLQRRTLPFAWIAGSALTGLTGAGAVTVEDCLGAIVDLTTVPASWGSSTDTPRRLYPAAGLVQGQLGSEWDDGQWIRYEHQVVLWQDPWATGLRYNFKPGVVATITPLYPEP